MSEKFPQENTADEPERLSSETALAHIDHLGKQLRESSDDLEQLNVVSRKWKNLMRRASVWLTAGIVTFTVMKGLEKRLDVTPNEYIAQAGENHEISNVSAEELAGMINYVLDKVPSTVLGEMYRGGENRYVGDTKPDSPRIEGFESEVQNSGDLRQLWSDRFYPNGFIEGQVSDISYGTSVDDLKHLILRNLGLTSSGGDAHASTSSSGESVVFHQMTDEIRDLNNREKVHRLDYFASHEFAHSNDWVRNNELSLSERLQFLYESVVLFEEKWAGVDELRNDKSRYHTELLEWWARLCSEYFDKGTVHDDDDLTSHVEKWVVRQDLSFDVGQSVTDKDSFIDSAF